MNHRINAMVVPRYKNRRSGTSFSSIVLYMVVALAITACGGGDSTTSGNKSVPAVTGLTQTNAQDAITTAGLDVGTVTQASSATVPPGSVISQNPAAGTSVAAGTAVDLVISSGPPNVNVPAVTLITQANAQDAITAAGLVVGKVTQTNSTTVPPGSVISQNPAAGASVAPGSAVNLAISSGPPPRVSVPAVTGFTQADAQAAIVTAGLVVGTAKLAGSSTAPVWSVISQSPSAGTSVAPGTDVDLIISSGPPSGSPVVTGADLVIDSLTATPSMPVVGQKVTITAVVRNRGGAAATANNFEIDLYKNRKTKPHVSHVGDVTCFVTSLAGGATATCSGTVTYDKVRTYRVRAQVDTLNAVIESNEKNNLKGPVRVRAKLPDLVISKLAASPVIHVGVGQTVALSATVRNSGRVSAGAFEIDLYKNRGGRPGASELGDVTCNVPGLAARATTTCSGSVSYGMGGIYRVMAQVDTQREVMETRESNNVKGPVKVRVELPDLSIFNLAKVSTGRPAVGRRVTLKVTVKNLGWANAGAFKIDLYKNLNTKPGVAQAGDATCNIPGLAARTTTTCSGTVIYDEPGFYWARAQVDTYNAVTESKENNNSVRISQRLEVR